jgi:hypothetical protein
MTTELITTINTKEIITYIFNDTQKIVPITPICEAIGILVSYQVERIEADAILNPAFIQLSVSDENEAITIIPCLPIKYILGWIGSIITTVPGEDYIQNLDVYKEACYDAFYDYLTQTAVFYQEKARKLNEFISTEIELKNKISNSENLLIQTINTRNAYRYLTFEEWQASQNQTPS